MNYLEIFYKKEVAFICFHLVIEAFTT
jgi:hypothetical protein